MLHIEHSLLLNQLILRLIMTKQIIQFKRKTRLMVIDCKTFIHSIWYDGLLLKRFKLTAIVPHDLVEDARENTEDFLKRLEES